tara:strand:- start:2439 stop:3968 length:1530 start_codon:yes stop_codon:yes gene_type:complete
MELPKGTIRGEELNTLFKDSIEYHRRTFYEILSQYDSDTLFHNWRTIIRSTDEMINIPLELKNEEDIEFYLNLFFDFSNPMNYFSLNHTLSMLQKNFDSEVAERFKLIAFISFGLDVTYQVHKIFEAMGSNMRLDSTKNSINYFQSRRLYYLTTLNIIPKVAKGDKKLEYKTTLSDLNYSMEGCLMGITNAYYNLLLNSCLPDFEMHSDGISAKPNYNYSHLDDFFLEPQRLSLSDQLTFRANQVIFNKKHPLPKGQIFSFNEIRGTMSIFSGAFDKYNIKESPKYKLLDSFIEDISIYVEDDYDILISENIFKSLYIKYKKLELYNPSDDYFTLLNSYSPFQKNNDTYYSTVVLVGKFVYRVLTDVLSKNKSFQINSGFIFEDMVSKILEKHDFQLTGITRINRKEFDVITLKDNKIYNFQCKNSFIDISRVDGDYIKIGRLNRKLVSYYARALKKEVNREHLVKEKLDNEIIEHFVVSRYPVITRNNKIINFNDLERWLKDFNQYSF